VDLWRWRGGAPCPSLFSPSRATSQARTPRSRQATTELPPSTSTCPPRVLRRLGFSTGRRCRGCRWARAGSPAAFGPTAAAARHVAPAAAEAAAAAAAALGRRRVRPRRQRQGEEAVLVLVLRAAVQGGHEADQGQVVVRGQLLLAGRVRVLRLVAAALSLQRDAGLVPAVCHGGHHGAAPGPSRGQAAEGGAPC